MDERTPFPRLDGEDIGGVEQDVENAAVDAKVIEEDRLLLGSDTEDGPTVTVR